MGEQLREFLATRDEPCPNCGYNLRGLQGAVCPECRQELVLRINMLDPAWKSLIATVMGLTVGAGMPICFELFFWGVVVFGGENISERERVQLVIVPSVIGLIFLVPLVVLVSSVGRRWFRSRSVFIRVVIASAAWILPLAAIAGWLVWVIND